MVRVVWSAGARLSTAYEVALPLQERSGHVQGSRGGGPVGWMTKRQRQGRSPTPSLGPSATSRGPSSRVCLHLRLGFARGRGQRCGASTYTRCRCGKGVGAAGQRGCTPADGRVDLRSATHGARRAAATESRGRRAERRAPRRQRVARVVGGTAGLGVQGAASQRTGAVRAPGQRAEDAGAEGGQGQGQGGVARGG
jgi:hypothetical protein